FRVVARGANALAAVELPWVSKGGAGAGAGGRPLLPAPRPGQSPPLTNPPPGQFVLGRCRRVNQWPVGRPRTRRARSARQNPPPPGRAGLQVLPGPSAPDGTPPGRSRAAATHRTFGPRTCGTSAGTRRAGR